jgi:hypothetical protein
VGKAPRGFDSRRLHYRTKAGSRPLRGSHDDFVPGRSSERQTRAKNDPATIQVGSLRRNQASGTVYLHPAEQGLTWSSAETHLKFGKDSS